MTKMKHRLLFLCSLLFFLTACGGDNPDTPVGGNEFLNVSNIDISGDKTTVTLNVQASPNCEWSVSCGESWVSNMAPSSGRGSREVTITLSGVNPSSQSPRTATITVRNSSGSITRDVTLTQMANTEYLEISGESLQTFTNKADSRNVMIRSNTHWTVGITGNTDWISVTPTEGDNDGSITVSANDNTTNEERTAVVTLKGALGTSKELTVRQVAGTLEFETKELSFTNKAESRKVAIHSNTHWTISITGNTDWISVTPMEGNNDGSITVAVKANTTNTEQEAMVTVNGTGGLSDVLKVIQAAASAPTISLPQVLSYTTDEATVSFTFDSVLPVTSCGVCYSTERKTPDIKQDVSVAASSTTSPVQVTLTGLSSGTTYYVYGYVITTAGEQYSEAVTFTTRSRWPNADDVVTPN